MFPNHRFNDLQSLLRFKILVLEPRQASIGFVCFYILSPQWFSEKNSLAGICYSVKNISDSNHGQ